MRERKVPLASDIDPRIIARGTPGFSGADLANLVNEAALVAARKGQALGDDTKAARRAGMALTCAVRYRTRR